MPKNIVAGTIVSSQDVNVSALPTNPASAPAQHSLTISPTTRTVSLRSVPQNTATQAALAVFLPPEPNNEDSYTVLDADGTVSVNSVVVVLPDPAGTATVLNTSAFPLLFPLDQASLEFDAAANNWNVDRSGNFSINLIGAQVFTDGAVTPGDLTSSTTTPAILFAVEIPANFVGFYDLQFDLVFQLSAADTVTLRVKTASGVTAFGGGTLITGPGQVQARYESTSPVVVTASSTTEKARWTRSYSGAATDTASWSGSLNVAASGAQQTTSAILVTIETQSGATLTAMSLNFSARLSDALP
jgi:hypothetical protein